MPILPLPQFEADLKAMLDEEDRRTYEALKAPKTMVVRFGAMKFVGEYPYSGDAKPGCGSKIVCRTHRGTELGEMLTSTCPNSGCSKSVSRKEMLGYIQNSGGRDYPFFTEGRVLRVATVEDLDRQAALEQSRHGLKLQARSIAERLGVHAKIVDAEPILGGEVLTIFYLSEERLDLRDLQHALSDHFKNRVDLRQVGARDEARLTADYEKCGQYCCCKNFLKVLKPVSMKSAKVQKATLDPLKISGRCGRLMCCLRYEDQTYDELKKRLPRKKSRVGTPEGDGMVLEGQILTQLVLIELDEIGSDGKIRHVAIPVEDLTEPTNPKPPVRDPAMQTGRPGGRPPIARGAAPARPRPGMTPPAPQPSPGAAGPQAAPPQALREQREDDRTRGDRPRRERPEGGDRRDRGDGPRGPRPQRNEPRNEARTESRGEARSDTRDAPPPQDRPSGDAPGETGPREGGPREGGPREGGPRPGGKRRRRGRSRSPEGRGPGDGQRREQTGGDPSRGDPSRGEQARNDRPRDDRSCDGQSGNAPSGGDGPGGDGGDAGQRKRRRRRRGRGRGPGQGGGGGEGGGGGGGGSGGSPDAPSNS